MPRLPALRRVPLAVAFALCVAGTVPTALAQGYESTPRLPAAALAPGVPVRSADHHVAEPVTVQGFFGSFELIADVGKFKVLGRDMLAVRIAELHAIRELNKVDNSKSFTDALARSAQAPVKLAENLVTDPGKTVENIAEGAGTILGRIGRMAKSGAERVADEAEDLSSSKKPAAAPAQTTGEPTPPSFTGDPFGYNKSRREWAAKLGIDPYTTNPILRPKLDRAATASFAGGFAIETAIGMVAGPVQYAVEFDASVRDSVWNLPVIDLQSQNEGKLKAMGIEGRPVRDFFRNRWFTPTLQTALVTVLGELPNVRGRDGIVKLAATVQGETRARFLIGSLRMLAAHHRAGTRLATLSTTGLVPIGRTAGGETIVAASIDHLWWNAGVEEFMRRPEVRDRKPLVLIAGRASPRAEQELARRGWRVRTGLHPAGSPQG